MPIDLTCNGGHQLRVPDQFAGRKVRCPKCRAVATVPTVAADEAADRNPNDSGRSQRTQPPRPSDASDSTPPRTEKVVPGRTGSYSVAASDDDFDDLDLEAYEDQAVGEDAYANDDAKDFEPSLPARKSRRKKQTQSKTETRADNKRPLLSRNQVIVTGVIVGTVSGIVASIILAVALPS
jgi:hypothetical protein